MNELQLDPVAQAAAKLEPKLRQAFETAIASVKLEINLAQLEQAILEGPETVSRTLNLEQRIADALRGTGIAADMDSVKEIIERAYVQGATSAIGKLPRQVQIAISFDLLNDHAVRFLQNYEFGLIREVSAGTRRAIGDIVQRAYTEGMHPRAAAREIRGLIGLTEHQSAAVRRFQDMLASPRRSELRQTLNRELRDRRFDATIRRALADDVILSRAQIERMSQRYYERYLKHRAEVIARTETQRASNAGQRELWRQGQEQGLIPRDVQYRVVTAGDERVCDICGPLDRDLSDRSGEHGGIGGPPFHVMCRCGEVLDYRNVRRVAA